ncbi:hypothetical protein QHH11_12650 [Aphanizomenon sp. PH219]|jgi:hypothetical protein|uniref:Type ISP restriction-modification enzyme LLaBIII C-terminal specificity domain-containing protein n=1 Tax=Dolichospermum heterosporum TAC447 TaxID=747523 RepID=A0ABY5LZQ5_9CYAN|nr:MULTISPECIES: hypothetical protein [Aphanizomenonaceae]MDK2410820.1 hypothetical protein [Aphanizomenon sp. 202]MDK2459975.1 hypothetical protein [Aphanizomenon sp. PH219]UUO15059.1 hypothetical protein NG743_24135 [Dolichospermum heterosporum TAC447]
MKARGYQVCQKWLKDRKGRQLNFDEISHYQNIISIISETIKIMEDIDKIIEKYGGFPLEFKPLHSYGLTILKESGDHSKVRIADYTD